MRSYKRYKGARHLSSSLVTPLSLALSVSRARRSLSLTRLSLSPRYLPLRLPSRIVSGSFRPIIRPSLFLGPLPQCIPHRTQHGFSSVVRFLSGYISSGTSARVWPLDLYFPSFSSPPPSRLLFFPFPFASGHLLSCEANWYPNGSGVFLTLFVSSVYPPLRDSTPEFGVSLPVVSFFFGTLVFPVARFPLPTGYSNSSLVHPPYSSCLSIRHGQPGLDSIAGSLGP